ncbi:MAG: polysaccharide deacetylase family protein [Flavobacteriales bacterium]
MYYLHKTPGLIKKTCPSYIWDIPTKNKTIYLSFDDGPHPDITPEVLKILNEYGALATFFCVGANVKHYQNTYKKIIDNNHKPGKHTYHHLKGSDSSVDNYIKNIENTEKLIKTKLFRPPYGRLKKTQAKKILKKNYKIVMWDILAGDFDQKRQPEKSLKKMIKYSKKGSIILFHDSEKAYKNMIWMLPRFLTHMKEKDFEFSIIS